MAISQEQITIEIGRSIALDDPVQVGEIFISDPAVADASVTDNNTVFLFGRSAGETTLITTPLGGGDQRHFTIIVSHPVSEIRKILNQRFPGQAIGVSSSRGSVLLSGFVSDDQARATVVETLESAFPSVNIIDRLTISGSGTIRLQVRLLEVNRSVAETFGIDWNATIAGSGFFANTSNRGVISFGTSATAESQLDATVDVLTSNNIAAIDQITELSTVLGETASFAAGGEIPVPGFISGTEDSTNGNFRLDYRFVGTELQFTPRLVPGNKIQLLVVSSVSANSGSNGTVNGNSFPNLSTRSFRTTVEMDDGVSFAIAGLSQKNSSEARRDSKGNPLSNAVNLLFGTDETTSSNNELLVIVTPFFGPATIDDQPLIRPYFTSNLDHILSNTNPLDKVSNTVSSEFGGFKY